jgi:hypothetical protein
MGIQVEAIVPPERLDQFTEFHAWELFGGYGVFEGVEQSKRLEVAKQIMLFVKQYHVPIIFGAVSKLLLRDKVYASADPIDICFRICAQGGEQYVGDSSPEEFAILIADDFDREIKARLRKSFRDMRLQVRPPTWTPGELRHIHDDLYFGSSKESIGIQLADMCSYVIGKHLEDDPFVEGFYDMIKEEIKYARIEPNDVQKS